MSVPLSDFEMLYNHIEQGDFEGAISWLQNNNILHLDTVWFSDCADTSILPLFNKEIVTLRDTNPVTLAIHLGQFKVLQALLNYHSQPRVTYQGRFNNYDVTFDDGHYVFSNLALPLALQTQNSEILTFLLKQNNFVVAQKDILSVVQAALSLKWFKGLKQFLQSSYTMFVF